MTVVSRWSLANGKNYSQTKTTSDLEPDGR
jgi:hypothetical protein